MISNHVIEIHEKNRINDATKANKDYNNSNNVNNHCEKKNNIDDDESTQASTFEKDYYNSLEIMNAHLKENYSKFFDNFELTNFISYGGTGRVYEGRLKNIKNKQKLAFKFKMALDRNKKNDKDSQEISILRKLHHKNITEIYAFIKMPDNSNFSVLELGKHGDLENFEKVLLKRKVLSETILCYFAKQILEALDYIHKCKIIHMDIKEGNILVDSNLNIKITDFSISCSYSAFHPADIVKFPFAGSSKYLSPEIINRTQMKIKDSCKIDLYSLGITLYNLVYGFFPYKLNDVKNKDYDNILNNIQKENLEFPSDRKISNLFKNFLKCLLEKDYTKRINIKQALNHPWIHGAYIILDEKENAFCNENFLINVITDNIPAFNQYINKHNYTNIEI